MSNKPNCFTPEKDVVYPLCVGQDKDECKECNFHIDFGNDYYDYIDQ